MIAIEKGDIIKAALDAAATPKIMQLLESNPMLMLLFPIIGIEIENILFGEDSEDTDKEMNNDN